MIYDPFSRKGDQQWDIMVNFKTFKCNKFILQYETYTSSVYEKNNCGPL